VATLEHPPHFPDIVTADFYLLPLLKSALKGRCFCVATDIYKNATKELKRLHYLASRNVSETSRVADRSVQLHMELFLKEMQLRF
jgi:hypothetical protein